MEENSSSESTDSVEEKFHQLEVTEHEDSIFMSPDTESTASTQSDDATATQENSRQRLNSFLISSGISPIATSWQTWGSSSDSTRRRYTKKSAEGGVCCSQNCHS